MAINHKAEIVATTDGRFPDSGTGAIIYNKFLRYKKNLPNCSVVFPTLRC